MVNLMYPTGVEIDLTTAAVIRLDKQYTGHYFEKVGDFSVVISTANDRFFANISDNGTFGGPRPILYKTESLNFDTLKQSSNRFDYLNFYDTVDSSNLPRLSSGKCEQPCHHESVSGTININPDISQEAYDSSKLYPMSISLLDTSEADWDGTYAHILTVEGVCLGRMTCVTTSSGAVSPPFLQPYCWLTMKSTHYYWIERWPDRNLTLEQAQKRGIVNVETVTCTPSFISASYFPTIYLKDARPYGDWEVKMLGEVMVGVTYHKLTDFSTSSSLNLPNVDALKHRLQRDIPSMCRSVASKIKYPDEIWYNLILAGAKEIKRLDMNNIANLLEIPGMIRAFDKIYNKFVSVKSGSRVYKNPTTGAIIKKASCIYLGIHYGIKLTVLDLQEIIKTFRDNPSLLRQLRRRVVSYSQVTVDGNQYNCKSCMSPKAGREVTDMRDFSRILGLELSTLNLWDLVPWSFVVDWFIPISDILDSFENIARLESTYDLEYLLETVSRSESVTWEGYSLRIKVYDRYITDHMPEFGFTVGDASGLNNHVIEASALVINSVR